MRRIDFVVANAGHHTEAALAVLEQLRATGEYAIRAASLTELRGVPSPEPRFAEVGVPLVRLFPGDLRRSAAGGPAGRRGQGDPVRRLARASAWHLLLRPRVSRLLESPPHVVVLPNDGAFPYDRICAQLDRRRIPYVILQEGIRFDTPAESGQGASGAAAFAVWGASSRDYFEARGARPDRVVVTGAPRFDTLVRTDWRPRAEALRSELDLGSRNLLFLSNPIDDLGFVTTAEKHGLIQQFAESLGTFLARPGSRLVIKLHRREDAPAIRDLFVGSKHAKRILVLQEAPLYPLLSLSDGAVTFASTVGLEALLLGVPLAILEVPGHGFVHDFVSSGAAEGLSWGDDLGRQTQAWLRAQPARAAAAGYLDATVENRGRAAAATSRLIAELAASSRRLLEGPR